METKTTQQAATELGMSRQVLINYIRRHPELRPVTQIPNANLLMWTDNEIEAIRRARAAQGRGRPNKK